VGVFVPEISVGRGVYLQHLFLSISVKEMHLHYGDVTPNSPISVLEMTLTSICDPSTTSITSSTSTGVSIFWLLQVVQLQQQKMKGRNANATNLQLEVAQTVDISVNVHVNDDW